MKKKCLEKRIKELEKLVEQKDQIIELLMLKLDVLKDQSITYTPPFISLNTDKCYDGNDHDYPNPWYSIIPPACKKCGKIPNNDILCNDTGNDINFNMEMENTNHNTFNNNFLS